MKARAPAPSWLRWLLLAAFAGCLNPHPDDEPTAISVVGVPGGKDENEGASSGSNGSPPVLIDDDEGAGQESEPSQEVADADAGVPAADAGVTGGDAGRSETP